MLELVSTTFPLQQKASSLDSTHLGFTYCKFTPEAGNFSQAPGPAAAAELPGSPNFAPRGGGGGRGDHNVQEGQEEEDHIQEEEEEFSIVICILFLNGKFVENMRCEMLYTLHSSISLLGLRLARPHTERDALKHRDIVPEKHITQSKTRPTITWLGTVNFP